MSDPVKYGAVWNGINPLTGQPYKWGDDIYYDSPVAPSPNPTKPMLFSISRAFAKYPLPNLDDFATNVAVKMVANVAIFANPTIPIASLSTAQVALHAAIAAAGDGGKQLNATKLAKGEAVVILLRQLASYIEGIPNLTPENAALSGFEVIVPMHHAAMAPDVPAILNLFNAGGGALGVKLQGSAHAHFYVLRVRDDAGKLVYEKSFSSTLNILLPNLTPGKVYTVDACAQGGGDLLSAYCPSVNCMCT
jgi:hypothetical protein